MSFSVRCNRYYCVHCGMVHLSICTLLQPLVDEADMSLADMAKRMCKECKEPSSSTGRDATDAGLKRVGASGPTKKKKRKTRVIEIDLPVRQTMEDCRSVELLG